MKRALKWILAVLVGLLAAGWSGGWLYLRSAWPQMSGELAAPGLIDTVEIRRDSVGVPHIFAKNEHDLFFAQGYVHAQDRLWQLVLGRALGRGELSKMLGQAALESDKATRTLGLVPAAKKDLELLTPDARAAINAYVDGVNAFLASGAQLPVEMTILGVKPGKWEPLDVMLVAESIQLAMSLNSYYEVTRVRLSNAVGERGGELIPLYPADGPTTLTRADEPQREAPVRSTLPPLLGALAGLPGGSNAWVVHGSRTTTGKPLLANDTHLGLALPSIWYENGLHAGRHQVVGFSFPGAPFVAVGHNGHVAWGVTNMCSDVQDLYLEKLDDPKAPTAAEYQGVMEPLGVRQESIEVKGGAPVPLVVRSTRHGPLVNEVLFGAKELPPVSLRWAAREGSTLFNALEAIDRAQDWKEFRQALRAWDSPSLNFVFADVDGTIGYQGTGRIPMRAGDRHGTRPAEGWTGAHEWTGFIPFEELPFAINPPAGFIVSANNKVAPDSYAHHLTDDWGDPFRVQRITDVLAKNPHVSPDDMRALQADDASLPAEALLPFLLKVKPSGALEQKAFAQLEGWDRRFTTSSTAASVYYVWYATLLDEIIGDELGEALLKDFRPVALTHTPLFIQMMKSGDSPWFDDVRTPEKETRDELSARAFTQAVAWLSGRLGPDPTQWRWGRLHTMTFAHQPFGMAGIKPLEWLFNTHTVEASGEPYSVNATFHNTDVPFAVASGPAQRFVADLSNLGASVGSTPVGQSGLSLHPHREDQVDAWAHVTHHPMYYGREAAMAAPGETLTLHPPKGIR